MEWWQFERRQKWMFQNALCHILNQTSSQNCNTSWLKAKPCCCYLLHTFCTNRDKFDTFASYKIQGFVDICNFMETHLSSVWLWKSFSCREANQIYLLTLTCGSRHRLATRLVKGACCRCKLSKTIHQPALQVCLISRAHSPLPKGKYKSDSVWRFFFLCRSKNPQAKLFYLSKICQINCVLPFQLIFC